MRRYDNVQWRKEEGVRLKRMGLGSACLWTAHSGKIVWLTMLQTQTRSLKDENTSFGKAWSALEKTNQAKNPKYTKGGSRNTVTKNQTNRSSFVNSVLPQNVCFWAFWNIYIRAPLFCSTYGPFINIVNIQSGNSPVLPGQGSFWNMDFTAREGMQRSHNSVILSETWCVCLYVPCIFNWLFLQLWCVFIHEACSSILRAVKRMIACI